MVGGRQPVDAHLTCELSAGEVWNQAVDRSEQRGLPAAGRSDNQAQLALGDVKRDVTQHRTGGIGIGDGDPVELDHATAPAVAVRAGAERRGVRAGLGGGGAAKAGRAASTIATVGSTGRLGH